MATRKRQHLNPGGQLDHVPSRTELIEYLRYLVKELVQLDWKLFTTGGPLSEGERERYRFVIHQSTRIKDLLGEEAVRKLARGIYTRYSQKRNKSLSKIFVSGGKD